ncbi:MAG: protein-L-isoaspartate(D-aspartate) O-methyltransferase [Deltaproteobacteria bacterium]
MILNPLIASLLLMGIFQSPSLTDEEQFHKQRLNMVERDIKGRGITDKRVIAAMTRIKRHLFVPSSVKDAAYADHPLPIGEGQTISQPYIVALMSEELRLKEGEKVLEIGTGSGYQAAVLAEMGIRVRSIEIRKGLADSAQKILNELGYKGVEVRYGDGYFGWEEEGPFDAIMVTAAANHIPPHLIKQLKEGGRLIIPVGSTTYYQTLTLLTKIKGSLDVRHIMGVAFVPMVGKASE